jgi:hypothetical protein
MPRLVVAEHAEIYFKEAAQGALGTEAETITTSNSPRLKHEAKLQRQERRKPVTCVTIVRRYP